MHLARIQINNFRLLQNVDIRLNVGSTVIVGQNNSGKTSLTEVCRRMLCGKSPSFRLEDFSVGHHEDFWTAFRMAKDGKGIEDVRLKLPTITVAFMLDYSDSPADVGALGEVVIDLNDACTTAIISATYALKDGRIAPLFDGIKDERVAFFKAMQERIPQQYATLFEAVDPNDKTNRKILESSFLSKIVACGFIGAQRTLSDDTQSDKAVIGKILESLFNAAGAAGASDEDKRAVEALREAVSLAEDGFNAAFNLRLDKIVPSFKTLGYPRMTDPEIRTKTNFDIDKLLSNHTTVGYLSASSVRLPESFNGLGPRNLIYIILKLIEAYKLNVAAASAPAAHVVFIEEPEAHLHPQMQAAFVRQLDKLAREIPKSYGDNAAWDVQFIITTHSSHVANEAPFEHMRHFSAIPTAALPAIMETQIKDLCTGMQGEERDNIEFLHEYMTLTRCDLLFADYCILVEGAVERLFLPRMIRKVDEARPAENALSAKYLSVIEVGGAHAKAFFRLLNFLQLKTLVVTDLDSVVATTGSPRAKKCPVHLGEHSSNPTINEWFKSAGRKLTIQQLIGKSEADKINGAIRLAFQMPEDADGPCGRSFEDAFMLANRAKFKVMGNTSDEMAQMAYDEVVGIDKTDFALTHAIQKSEWSTPRYIAEGLAWIAGSVPVPLPADGRA